MQSRPELQPAAEANFAAEAKAPAEALPWLQLPC
jgi:hypothetical protein